MALADRLVLAQGVAGALGRIALDAAVSPVGRALPLAPEALTDARTLEGLLDSGPLGGRRIREVRRIPREAPSSNCRNSVLEVTWDADDAALPVRLFAKQPSDDVATRLFANVIGFWWIECAVCRNLADALPIASPRIFAVEQRRSRFVLLMEDLETREDVRLHVNRELVDGVDLATAERCIGALARLHAGFADWSGERRARALPLALHPFRSPTLRPVMLAVNRLAAAPCQRRAPDVFDDAGAALYRRAMARWADLERRWYSGPPTLVHGDSHLGNFFEAAGTTGLLDFQGAHWGRGIRDVQYFLVNSMSSDRLARHERDLVAAYAREVTSLGAPLDPETAWDEYRGFAFQTLMTAVVSLGLGSFTDSDAVMRSMLTRSVAAIRRLDFAGWLDALD